VPKVRSFFVYWFPALVWMAVIFSASADTESTRHSSRLLKPLLRWLFPHLSETTLDLMVLVTRKCAHLTEYAILAVLFWRALRKPVRHDPRPWDWRKAGWAILLVALYAGSDEFHQLFVPGREGTVRDVIIDTIGGVLGLVVLGAIVCWRAWRRRRTSALVAPT
jgi:VanZ family protein